MQPIRPPGARDPRRRRRVGSGRGWAVLGVVTLLLVGLYALGKIDFGGSGGNDAANTTPPTTTTTKTTKKRSSARAKRSGAAAGSAKRKKPPPKLVRLRFVPTGPVYVCLKRAGGGTVVNGRILQAGSRQPTYRSRRFRVRLGNSEVRLLVNGRTRQVPPTGGVLGYEVTPPGRLRPLPASSLPACGA
jgi:hypothetical protein